MSYHLSVLNAQQTGEPTIYGPECPIQRNRASDVVKRVDQLLEAALRPHNDLAQLVELIFRGRSANAALKVLQQDLEVGDLPLPSVGIGREQDRQQQQAGSDSA